MFLFFFYLLKATSSCNGYIDAIFPCRREVQSFRIQTLNQHFPRESLSPHHPKPHGTTLNCLNHKRYTSNKGFRKPLVSRGQGTTDNLKNIFELGSCNFPQMLVMSLCIFSNMTEIGHQNQSTKYNGYFKTYIFTTFLSSPRPLLILRKHD